MEWGSIFVGWLLGLLTSWAIAQTFAVRSDKTLKQNLDRQTSQLTNNNSWNTFERLLRTAPWQEETIDNRQVWVCQANNLFQFHCGDDLHEFREKWTAPFPQSVGSMFHVNLTIGGTIVRSFPFVSCDGSRYTLPLPDLALVDAEQVFCWYSDAIETRIAEIMANFYRYRTIQEVARLTGVEVVRGDKPKT